MPAEVSDAQIDGGDRERGLFRGGGVRNPVYLGSLLIFFGEALLFGSLRLLVYTAAGWAGAAVFVRWYEEPALTRRFGAEYEAYRRAVPAWRPRLRPWSG
jgi:protein-S-isoprenylcysteine O-methyltransferase Ste14